MIVCALLATLVSGTAFAESFSQNQIKSAFTELQSYDLGMDPTPVHTIHEILRFLGAGDKPQLRSFTEKHMILLLESNETSYAAKLFICQQLYAMGSDACNPVLGKMLLSAETTEMACYALYTNPSEAADDVLRQALNSGPDETKVSIIKVLGDRKDAQSVDLLIPLVDGEEDQIAGAAARALGKISGDKATKALRAARATASGERHAVLTEGYMMAAEGYAANNQSAKAFAIYTELLKDSEPLPVRRGALIGAMLSGHSKAANTMVAALKQDEPVLVSIAIAHSSELKGSEVTQKLVAAFKRAAASIQVQLIKALAQRGDPAAKAAINGAVSSRHAQVRMAAFTALAEIGTKDDVALLCGALKKAELRDDVTALKATLQRMEGDQVSRAILDIAKSAEPSTKVLLIQLIASRQYAAAVPQLFAFAKRGEANVARAALRAIGLLASTDDIPALLDLYVDLEGQTLQGQAFRALTRVIGRNDQHQEAVAKRIQGRLDRANAIGRRCSLLKLLSFTPNELSLQCLKAALEDRDSLVRDTAIRTLARYPDSSALDTLLEVFQSASESVHRTLALRACVRLLKTGDIAPQQAMEIYRQLAADAAESSEKKLILSGLAAVPHPAALQLIKALGRDVSVSAEAALAYKTLADAMPVLIDFSDSSKALAGRKGKAELLSSPISGKALSLDGSSAYIELPRTEAWSVGSKAFSVSLWIKPETIRHSGLVCVGGYGWRHGWFIDLRSNGAIRLETSRAGNENNGVVETPGGLLSAGKWTHIAVVATRGNDKARIFINGEEAASERIGAADLTNPEAKLVIGAIETFNNTSFHGQIDEVALSKAVLPDNAIRRMAQRGPKLLALDKEAEKKIQKLLQESRNLPLLETAYKSIFDGKTFAGWEGDLSMFRIKGGAIVAGTLAKKIEHNYFLATEKAYYNFDLQFKVKLSAPNVNAGLQFRSKRIPNHHEVSGYQADVGARFWGGLYDESRRQVVLAPVQKEILDEIIKSTKENEWTDYRVRCVDNRVQLIVNGIKACDYIEPDQDIAKMGGIIAVQIHSGPAAEAWYKDVQIKELP